MIDFVGAPPFLRIALRVTMAIMHFHILALTGLFLGDIFFALIGVPGNNLAPMKNCPWGAKYVKLDTGVKPVSSSIVLYFVFSPRVFSISMFFSFFKCQFRGCGKPPYHFIFICSCLCL